VLALERGPKLTRDALTVGDQPAHSPFCQYGRDSDLLKV
jgi:hypothetical protein